MSKLSKRLRTYVLAPLFEFLISSFIPKQKNIASTKHQSKKPQSSLSKDSNNPKVFENIRTFTLALHKFIHTISGVPNNVGAETIKTLHRFEDALNEHKHVLNGLTSLYYDEMESDNCLQLWRSLEQGVRTNASILDFTRQCCHDGHPRGLLKHQAEVASFSYMILRATDKLLNVIYAYKVAKGEAP